MKIGLICPGNVSPRDSLTEVAFANSSLAATELGAFFRKLVESRLLSDDYSANLYFEGRPRITIQHKLFSNGMFVAYWFPQLTTEAVEDAVKAQHQRDRDALGEMIAALQAKQRAMENAASRIEHGIALSP